MKTTDTIFPVAHNSFRLHVGELLSLFPERTQNILKVRYNLDGSLRRGKTLDAIGRQYGVTRERIRQIIQSALYSAREKRITGIEEAISRLESDLQERGGIFAKEPFIRELGSEKKEEGGAIELVLDLSDRFTWHSPDRYVTYAVSHSTFDRSRYNTIVRETEQYLQDKKAPCLIEDLYQILQDRGYGDLKKEHYIGYLLASASIDRNALNEWGLMRWGQIRPKSAGQRAYLVLRHYKRPMHFTEIAEKINTLGLASRRANPQTVHNELIKSPLFALSGRGTYTLSE